jgi:hypothetical protein
MVPLESVTKRSSAVEPVFVLREPVRKPEPLKPTPKRPPRFRIVDVTTRQTLLEGASTCEAVEALKPVRSVVDVDLYVVQEERDRWRLLTLAEQQTT